MTPIITLKDLADRERLRAAWYEVEANRGVPGIDRVSVASFGRELDRHLDELAREVLERRYRPLPALRIRPPFLASADRALVVPTVRDRVLQRTLADVLRPHIEPLLSSACAAFRKGGSATRAADRVDRWVAQGFAWVLRADVAAFFDSILPDLLLEKLRPFVDQAVFALLGRIVRARVFDHDALVEPVTGILQGSPLSPLLANLYLADMDHTMAARHPRYIRYCDDCIVLERSEGEVLEARSLVTSELARVGLALNEQKTHVGRVEDGFVFLGYQFGPGGKGPALKALEALDFRLDQLAREPAPPLEDLDALFNGWTAYYGLRPEAWTKSPVGVLALARQHAALGREELIEKVARPRWQLGDEPSWVTPALAEAWRRAGLEELAWVEFGRQCIKELKPDCRRWADCLGLDPETVSRVAQRVRGAGSEDRLGLLAEVAASVGRYEVASRLGTVEAVALAGGETAPTTATPDLVATADYDVLEHWFRGADGVHAVEQLARGQRRFVPVHRAINREDWRAHLQGERTIALPLLRVDGTTYLAVYDIDVERRESDRRFGQVEALLGRALGAGLKLRGALRGRGIESLLEFSGHKGYHVWVRFEEALPASLVRRFLHEILAGAGRLPEGIRVEVFPTRDRPTRGSIGPIIKLPLGIHGRTGRRCDLLSDQGAPVEDPFELLRQVPPAPVALVRDNHPATPQAVSHAKPLPELGPRATKIIEGCRVVGYLRDKVQATGYLNHLERTLLLCTLGHLGAEGAAALHHLIGRTYNYRREVTDRHIAKLPSHPISCGRIRELFPDVTASHPCACPAAPRSGGYPTPLLFALRPSQIPSFRARKKGTGSEPREGGDPPIQARAPGHAPSGEADAHALLTRIAELRRHQRGIEASLERARTELVALFDRLGLEAIATPLGTLRRTRAVDGSWEFRIEV